MKHTGRSPTAPCEQQVDDLEMDHIRDDDPRDDANEPLIENERDGVAGRTPERHASSGATSSPPFTATAATAGTRMLWLLTMSAGLSGLLFGYDTGIISSTLLHLPTTFPSLTTAEKSLIASSTSLLALFASPLSGFLADSFGRLPTIALATALFVVGALIQAVAPAVWVLILGRSVVGAAVGAASGIVPLYIAEIAPDKMRGRLVTVQSLFITGGQVVAYLIGWAVGERWRWGVGLGAAPAIVQSFLLLGMVESPRWLVRSEREEQAKRVLRKLGGGEEGVELLMRRMRREVDMESTGKAGSALKELWVNRGNRRALGIACGLQGLQQLCGFNSLMYFSATIFALVGFTNPIATSLSVASTNFLFTLLAFGLIDSIGRRRILLLSIPFMVLGLFCCAVAFNHISFGDGSSHVSSTTTVSSAFTAVKNVMRGRDGGTSDSAGGSGLPGTALLVSLLLYISAYAIGLGCVPWQQAELFPLNVRSVGSGIATATNWSTNFVASTTFLPLLEWCGPSVTFAGYAFVCALGWAWCWTCYPEMSGVGLEGVRDIGEEEE